MRTLFWLCTVTVFLCSCNQQKKYTLQITTTSEGLLGGEERKTKDETIYASNDSSAYYQAVQSYMISLKVSEDMKQYKYHTVPVSFEIRNDKGQDISLTFSQSFKDSAFNYQKKLIFSRRTVQSDTAAVVNDTFTVAQQKIAFGNLLFGMTEKEVDRLTKHYFQKIGDYEYSLEPLLDHNGHLYKIQIKSFDRDANYIDTDVKGSLDNLYETIKSKYGEGEYVQSFPNVLQFEAGYVKYTNRWKIGDKTIVIGAGEVSSGAEFYSFCWIYSDSMSKAEENYQKSVSDSIKSKDGSQF